MATLFDDASLVMIPSGYKDDKLYSIKPTSGDGDFTFSRDGSGASPATRVNSAGLIEKGRTNLLLQSNTFDTTWTNNGTTETGGQSGYDGTNDAWLLSKSAAVGRIKQSISSSGVNTFSVYAKEGTSGWMRLVAIGTANPSAYFNLSSGAVGTTANIITSNSENIGNGYYRYSISFNQASISEVRIYPAEGDNDISGTSGNIYIQDAQLEKGLVATSYIETTTAAASAGILGDMPRLDYSGGASCPSLLLEPARTNLVPFSEYLGSSDKGKTRCTIEDNSTTSPEGVNNASKMTSTDANESYIQDNLSFTGSTIVWSFFAKKGDLDYCHGLVWDLSANGCRQWFNLNDGTVGGSTTFGSGYSVSSATIEDYGSGWYRCTMIVSGSSGSNGCRVNISSADTTIGSALNSYGYFYGLQAEDSSYATSYVPTYGSATARAVDDIAKLNNASTNGLLNNYNTTFLFEGNNFKKQTSTNTRFVTLFDAAIASNPRILMFSNNSSATYSLLLQYRVSGQTDVLMSTGSTFDFGDNFKAVVKISSTHISFFVDGSKIGEQAIVQGNDVEVIDLAGLSTDMSHNAKQFVVFPTALTDAECIALTTL